MTDYIEDVNQYNETDLFKAVQDGDLTLVKTLLDHNFNINHQNQFGKTPLHIAAMSLIEDGNCNIEMFRLLIDRGAIINCQDNFKNTPSSLLQKELNDPESTYHRPQIMEVLALFSIRTFISL